MPIINLRSQYPHLSEDIFMEISDPIFEVYDHSRKQINNYDRRARYHRAFYSLDVGDGIETHAVSRVPSPEELWMRKLEKEQLREALEHLPPVHLRLLYVEYENGWHRQDRGRFSYKCEPVHPKRFEESKTIFQANRDGVTA